MYRAIFFDLDDTLFDRAAAFRRWVQRHLGDVSPVDLAWLVGLDARGRRSRLLFAAGVIEKFEIARTVTDLAAAFPRELAAHVEPEANVRDVVARLAIDRRVAIVSNGGSAQRDKLERAGLADLLPMVFISGELGVAKPKPEIFERALAWSELAASECLFVGDDPVNDLAPAAALGMGTVWRTREEWPVGMAAPQFTIDSIDELEACA